MFPLRMCRVENHFDAPPSYCQAWLTDFRSDDGRLLGDPTPIDVARQGRTITRRTTTPMGPMTQVVTLERPDRWTVAGEQHAPDGTLLLVFTITETVEPEGAGTRHTAEIVLTQAHPTMLPMLDALKSAWDANVRTIFSNVKPELETDFKRGKAAEA